MRVHKAHSFAPSLELTSLLAHKPFCRAEHGPPRYLHTLPHTNVPVADLWEVNKYVLADWKRAETAHARAVMWPSACMRDSLSTRIREINVLCLCYIIHIY